MNSVGNFKAWKCQGLDNFDALGFVNIGDNETNLKTWLSSTFGSIKGVNSNIKSVLLPYSKDLGSLSEIFQFLVKFLTL